MKRPASVRGFRTTISIVVLLSAVFLAYSSLAADGFGFLDDDYLYDVDPRDNLEKWEDFQNDLVSPNQEVPRGHWAYKALEHLAELGFLPDYDSSVFDGDRPATRYELAAMADKILKNYLHWEATGKVVRYKKIMVQKQPDVQLQPEQPDEINEPPEKKPVAPTEETKRVPLTLPAPILPNKDISISTPSGENITLTRTGPRGMEIMSAIPMIAETTALSTPVEDIFTEPKKVKIGDENRTPSLPEWEERTVKIEEEVELTQKDEDTIEKLLNTFKKEIKDLDKKFKKEIKGIERITLKNQRQIKKLRQEDERFKITGSDDFVFQISGNYDPPWEASEEDRESYYGEETRLYNNLSLTFSSKPDPQEDFTISATTKAITQLGSRTGYYGYIDRSNTAFNVHEFSMQYSGKHESSKNPRNFKLRSLEAGNTSVSYSPLTMFGQKLQGMSMSLKLNDYGINMFGGRMAYHYPQFLGQLHFHKPGDDTQYDRYVYGVNLQTSIFGEPSSMGNFQKIFMYDNYKTNYWGNLFGEPYECKPGRWVEMGFNNDPAVGIGDTSDESYKDLFCMPPEKNSVTSAFIRYPILKNINVTAEYAHSTYYKPRYAATFGPKYLDPDMFEKYEELVANGLFVPTPGDPYILCDTSNIEHYGSAGAKGCWYESKERREQDDGFLLLFDYSKGPIQIFPIGYAKLGSEFVTKYFGLPGFDMNSLLSGMGGDSDDEEGSSGGGGIGFLPIAIQSLEIFITNFTYDKQQDDNYKYSTYYIWGNEIEPMYFDPGLVMYGMSDNKDKGNTMGLLAGFIDKINTRRDTLKLSAWMNDLKYYLSDDISLNLKYTSVTLQLPPTCLDGDVVKTYDDFGNLVSITTGDGVYDCVNGENDPLLGIDVKFKSQDLELFWKTSKNAESTTTFSNSNLFFSLSYTTRGDPMKTIEDIVLDLVPRGRQFTLKQEFKYKLTSSTSLNFYYRKVFDRVYDEYTVDNFKYPVIDKHTFKFKISTTF